MMHDLKFVVEVIVDVKLMSISLFIHDIVTYFDCSEYNMM